jgi:hypothetical protein
MTADDLRKLYWADPFRPFQLDLADGRQIAVVRREWMAISPTGDTAVVAPTVAEMEIIDLPAVNGIRFFGDAVPTTAATGAA